jgi:hypothetical protein
MHMGAGGIGVGGRNTQGNTGMGSAHPIPSYHPQANAEERRGGGVGGARRGQARYRSSDLQGRLDAHIAQYAPLSAGEECGACGQRISFGVRCLTQQCHVAGPWLCSKCDQESHQGGCGPHTRLFGTRAETMTLGSLQFANEAGKVVAWGDLNAIDAGSAPNFTKSADFRPAPIASPIFARLRLPAFAVRWGDR